MKLPTALIVCTDREAWSAAPFLVGSNSNLCCWNKLSLENTSGLETRNPRIAPSVMVQELYSGTGNAGLNFPWQKVKLNICSPFLGQKV